jgi:tetratricopeptide (TPR) repeat protein
MILLSALMILTSCDKQPDKPTPSREEKAQLPATSSPETTPKKKAVPAPALTTTPFNLLHEPTPLHRFETVAEAMTVWREYAPKKPSLVLLTGSPALTRTPSELIQETDNLALDGTLDEIRARSSKNSPDPLFQSSMALDIALRSHWFSDLTWIMPMRDQGLAPDHEAIRTQFLERRMLSVEEANSLILDGQKLSGRIRDIPFLASNISQLSAPAQPILVHIDLNYFQVLYKNEIATPVLQTIYQTLNTLKEQNLQTVAVTFSYNHLDSQVALDVRFVGEILSTLFAQPELLSQPVPKNWQRQADSIYLSNFFQNERVDELHKAQEKESPDSAWIKFSLYRAAAEQKQGEQALNYLAEAVALDSMYAYEYGNLARMAYEKQRPDETLRMFTLAAQAFPQDPFIKLRMAELAAEIGDLKTAKHLVEQLQTLNWSEVYHPQMPEYLNKTLQRLEEE